MSDGSTGLVRTWGHAIEALRNKALEHLDKGEIMLAQNYITSADFLEEVAAAERNAPEYWIWSNEHGAWWRPGWNGYTSLLHEAGRYPKYMADQILAKANLTVAPDAWPHEVAILVTNGYMTAQAQRIIESVDDGLIPG